MGTERSCTAAANALQTICSALLIFIAPLEWMACAHKGPFKYSWARVEVELNDTSPLAGATPLSYQLSINLNFSLCDFGTANDSRRPRPFPLLRHPQSGCRIPDVIRSRRMCQLKSSANQMPNEDGAFSKWKLTATIAGDWLDNFLISVRALSSCWELAGFCQKLEGIGKGIDFNQVHRNLLPFKRYKWRKTDVLFLKRLLLK